MRGSDGLEDGAHVGERLLRLGLDPALDNLHRLGVEPDLARDVQGLVHHHGLRRGTRRQFRQRHVAVQQELVGNALDRLWDRH